MTGYQANADMNKDTVDLAEDEQTYSSIQERITIVNSGIAQNLFVIALIQREDKEKNLKCHNKKVW